MKPESKRAWKPVRRGRKYCSPACGSGCTHADFLAKKRKAAALVKALGKGWRQDVWENLGWHYGAKHKELGVMVYSHGAQRYWATTDYDAEIHQHHCEATTPRDAVKAIVKSMKEERAHIDRHLALLNDFN